MEIYKATADYVADFPGVTNNVLSISAGEKCEVLETESSSRHHQEWWGVRSLLTGQVGYLPSRFLQFSERIPEDALSIDHQAQRERQLRQLDTMQEEAPLPDIYKVPPLQVQSIEEWTNADDDKDVGPPVIEKPLSNGGLSGVVLRPKQDKQEKCVKSRKSFIDRLFGSKHKDKESKKEKKKGKATHPTCIEEDYHSDIEDAPLAYSEDDAASRSEHDQMENDYFGDSKENEPPFVVSSSDAGGARAMPHHDFICDDSPAENNNRSMTEDEWKSLIDGVESDLEFPKPPEPEIDYLDDDNNENDMPDDSPRIIQPALGSFEDLPKYLKPASSSENLVEPKKLPNPVVSSKLHQDLHREMESNRKMGFNVLNQKTELKKEFERREDRHKKKEKEEGERLKKTEIQKRLEEQKQKVDDQDKEPVDEIKKDSAMSEFQRIRTKMYSNKPS